MSWNYRVFLVVDPDNKSEDWYHVREAYYHEGEPNDAIPHSWGEMPIGVGGENVEEVRETLIKMLEACNKPVVVLA